MDLTDVLPADQRVFSYRGSLTTPPCSEVVEWRIIREPIEMSRAQLNAFIAVLDNTCCAANGNNRPTQPINGRRIFLDRSLGR